MAVSKPMQTEFGIHHRLESCVFHLIVESNQFLLAFKKPEKLTNKVLFPATFQANKLSKLEYLAGFILKLNKKLLV